MTEQRVRYVGTDPELKGRRGTVTIVLDSETYGVRWDDGKLGNHHQNVLDFIEVKVDAKYARQLDAVDKPAHYQFFPDLEAIEVIARSMTQEQFYGYCLGNRLKYRLRAGNKDKLEQDIAKSDKYIELYEQHKQKCLDAK